MKIRRISAAFLAILICAAAFAPAVSVSAADADGDDVYKEEVVYVNLCPDGRVSEINVVNIFELYGKGKLVDHGSYESLRNMTTTDEIIYENGVITLDSAAEKIYYEGKLKDNTMPWNISIRYRLDGKQLSAEEVAGKSGRLDIYVDITKNTSCKKDFFDAFALQVQLSLDTERCKNITADGATAANVGGDKQLSFTVLPGRGASLCVSADVTDFEYDGISVNGIPLDLNIDIDNAEILARVGELTDAVEKLDDGAKTLYDGASELDRGVSSSLIPGVDALEDGVSELKDGMGALLSGGKELRDGALALKNGASELDDGAGALSDGIGKMKEALDTLDVQSAALKDGSAQFKAALGELKAALGAVSTSTDQLSLLLSASSEIKNAINSIADGSSQLAAAANYGAYKAVMAQNGLDLDELKANNAAGIEGLNDAGELLQKYIAMMKAFNLNTSELEAQADNLELIKTLLGVNILYMEGTETYFNSLSSGASTLAAGAAKLKENYSLFDAQIVSLVDNIKALAYGISELSGGVDTLLSEYEKLDSGISAYTGGVSQIVKSYSDIVNGAKSLSEAASVLASGADTVYKGADSLVGGITEASSGVSSLDSGVGAFRKGVGLFSENISLLHSGMKALSDGTETLRSETSGLGDEVSGEIDSLIGSFTGEGVKTGSFVSDKNENVKSVQFVIKTGAVKAAPAPEPVPEEKAPLTFWQKLLSLFGLYK